MEKVGTVSTDAVIATVGMSIATLGEPVLMLASITLVALRLVIVLKILMKGK